MPRMTAADTLASMISKLQAARQAHMAAVAEIDALFERCGITPQLVRRRGRPPGSRSAAGKTVSRRRRRTRGKFATSGLDSIMAFVTKAGAKGVMGAEIAKHWKAEGRGTGVYVLIGKLVNAKKLKREKVKGGKGSRYSIA